MTWLVGSAVRLDTPRAHRLLAWVLACCVLSALSCRQPATLEPGADLEETVGPRAQAEYRLELSADRFVRLVVDPLTEGSEVELTVRWLSPAGESLVELPTVVNRYSGVLAWVTETDGDYRLLIDNSSPVQPVSYRIAELEVRHLRGGDVDRAAAMRFNAEAALAFHQGRAEAARALLEQARRHYELAGDLEGAVEILRDLTWAQSARDPEGALDYADEGLEIARREGWSQWVFEFLNWRGRILQESDYEGARTAFGEALEVTLEAGDVERELTVRNNLGHLHLGEGHTELAREAFGEGLARARELESSAGGVQREASLARQSEMLLGLLRVARRSGEIEAASEQIEEARRLAERSGSGRAEALVLHELGNIEERRGRLREAYEHFSRCAEINVALGHRANEIRARLSQGVVLFKLRQPEGARQSFQLALQLSTELGDAASQARARLELGNLWQAADLFDEAEEEYRRGLQLADTVGERERAGLTGLLLYGLGRLETERGRPAAAVQLLEEALSLQRQAGDRASEALTLSSLGIAMGLAGRSEAGLEALRAALVMFRQARNRFETLTTLYRLAEVQLDSDPDAARAAISAAIEIGQDIRRGLGVDRFRTDFAETTRLLYGLYVELLVRSGELEAAFAAAEEGRARAVLDGLAEARVDLRSDLDPALREEVRGLEARLNDFQLRLSAAGEDSDLAAELERSIERAESDWWRIEAALREGSLRYRSLSDPATLDASRVRELLAEGQVALEYWMGAERSYLFTIDRAGLAVAELPGEAEIRARVVALRTSMEAIDPSAFAAAARWLFERVVEPGLGPQSGRELIIVPDGPLHLLPFAALVVEAPDSLAGGFSQLPYLAKEFAIGYTPSLTTLSALDDLASSARSAGRPAQRRTVIFADPASPRELDYFCPSGSEPSAEPPSGERDREASSIRLPRLLGARREASLVASHAPGPVRVFLDEEATEGQLRSTEVATAGWIHFAVHGLVCESLPERSGLVLAPVPGSSDDGFLQMREIYGLDLSADLVVLSSCDSGAGREVSGEGVVNLARGFFYAGVPSVVVSLWQVSDETTAELMDSFYQAIAAGKAKDQALQEAQLAMIARGGRSASPWQWAPFVLLGRPR